MFHIVLSAAARKAAAAEAAKAPPPDSPYAAIANGKADVEGGIIQVAARRQGIVSEVLVQEGAPVAKGQILARQMDEDSTLAVNRARADVAQSRAQIALLEVQLRTARREAQRLQNLSASNFVAGQRLDAARDAIASAEATAPFSNIEIRKSRKPVEPLVSLSECGERPALTTVVPGTCWCRASPTVLSIFA